MSMKRKLSALLTAAAVLMSLCVTGCNKNESKTADSQAETKKPSSNTSLSPVELKDYAFPQFMENIKTPDMLSNQKYSSFDKEKSVKEVEEQPFEEYECIESCDDTYYTFKKDNHVGVINKHGTIIIDADKYSSAEFVSQSLVKLDYSEKSGVPSDFLRLTDGYGNLIEDFGFSEDRIEFAEEKDENTGAVLYALTVDGVKVYDGGWEKVTPLSSDELVTAQKPAAAYRVSLAGASYIITFDKYYNFQIYEGVYGKIKLKIGNVYGECYILDSDDYSELNKMITSFGDESFVTQPSKDITLDYIQIVFGMSTDDMVEITISSDGYCLTDSVTHNEQPANKYFSVLSKETFIDLVNWVNEALSEEYE